MKKLLCLVIFPINCFSLLINSKTVQFNWVLHRPLKLPVWPVWGGVVAQVFDWMKLSQLSEKFQSTIGGRVIPMTLSDANLSPFLLLVHHSHSFTPLDPFRTATKWFLPEGFPAHPHAGFDTVTYCIEGGLRHRDSEGFKMYYGDGEVQWMRAGTGMIHEEMWDLRDEWRHKRIELFQIWINLPAGKKDQLPFVKLLKNADIPEVTIECNGITSKVKVISGRISSTNGRYVTMTPTTEPLAKTVSETVEGPASKEQISGSPVGLFHLKTAATDAQFPIQTESCNTVIIFVRAGSIVLSGDTATSNEVRRGDYITLVPGSGSQSDDSIGKFTIHTGSDGLDALILMGRPIPEPVYMGGPFVENSPMMMSESREVFDKVNEIGSYWDHRMKDEDWSKHCEQLQWQSTIQKIRNAIRNKT